MNLQERVSSAEGTLKIEDPMVPTAVGPVPLPQLRSNIASVIEALGQGCGFATLEEIELAAIRRTLRLVNGNRSRAARILGIHIRTISNKLGPKTVQTK